MTSLYRFNEGNEQDDYDDHVSDEEYFSSKLYVSIENNIYETLENSLPERYSAEHPLYISEEKELFKSYLNSLSLLQKKIEEKIKE